MFPVTILAQSVCLGPSTVPSVLRRHATWGESEHIYKKTRPRKEFVLRLGWRHLDYRP